MQKIYVVKHNFLYNKNFHLPLLTITSNRAYREETNFPSFHL